MVTRDGDSSDSGGTIKKNFNEKSKIRLVFITLFFGIFKKKLKLLTILTARRRVILNHNRNQLTIHQETLWETS